MPTRCRGDGAVWLGCGSRMVGAPTTATTASAPTGAVDRFSSGLALRGCVDDFQGVAPQLHRPDDEPNSLPASAGSVDGYGAGVEDPSNDTLVKGQSFDAVVVQFQGVALDESLLDDYSS